MENKKISYITLLSDLCVLLSFAFIIYGCYFGFERIGAASLFVTNLDKSLAVKIAVLEIISCITMANILHKYYKKSCFIFAFVIAIANIIYRSINIFHVVSIFNVGMFILNVLIIIVLLLFNK